MSNNVALQVDLTERQALALAQFCKRVGHCDFKRNAASEDEAYAMANAHNQVYDELIRQGFNPR